jgi:hypothetical protein
MFNTADFFKRNGTVRACRFPRSEVTIFATTGYQRRVERVEYVVAQAEADSCWKRGRRGDEY